MPVITTLACLLLFVEKFYFNYFLKIHFVHRPSNSIIEVFDPVNNKVINTHPMNECSDVHSMVAV